MFSSRGSNGALIANAAEYPLGIADLGTYIHGLGLKFSGYGAPLVAGCNSTVGSATYETADAVLFASYGFDRFMYDNCSFFGSNAAAQYAYQTMGQALQASGRSIVFQVSTPLPSDSASFFGSLTWGNAAGGNGVVSSPDRGTMTFASFLLDLADQVGNTSSVGPEQLPLAGLSSASVTVRSPIPRKARATALWCILASPLSVSIDLTAPPSTNTLATITNTNAIAVDQDSLGLSGSQINTSSDCALGSGTCRVWAKQLNGSPNKWAVALLNSSASSQTLSITWTQLPERVAVHRLRHLAQHQPRFADQRHQHYRSKSRRLVPHLAMRFEQMRLVAILLALLAAATLSSTTAKAQSAGISYLYCSTGGSPPWAPCSPSNPLNVTDGGGGAGAAPFTPNGNFGTPLSVSNSSNSVALPSGTSVVLSNIGANAAYCNLGVGSATATTANLLVPAGGSAGLTVGSNTFLACITASSTTTINVTAGSGTFTGISGNAVAATAEAPYVFVTAGAGQYGLAVTTSTQLTVPGGTLCALLTLEGAPVRRTNDGSAPTTTSGTLIQPGTQWTDCGPLGRINIPRFPAIHL